MRSCRAGPESRIATTNRALRVIEFRRRRAKLRRYRINDDAYDRNRLATAIATSTPSIYRSLDAFLRRALISLLSVLRSKCLATVGGNDDVGEMRSAFNNRLIDTFYPSFQRFHKKWPPFPSRSVRTYTYTPRFPYITPVQIGMVVERY